MAPSSRAAPGRWGRVSVGSGFRGHGILVKKKGHIMHIKYSKTTFNIWM
jgi:hypothetical protein